MVENVFLLDMDDKMLKGTGTIAEFDAEVVDTYLGDKVRERTDFHMVSEEIWSFFKEKFDADHTIKRFYINKGG